MFADLDLARRIERAETSLSQAVADGARVQGVADVVALRVGSGLAVYAGPGSPVNKLIGMGFDGDTLDEAALVEAERYFDSRQEPLQAEVVTLSSPAILRTLCDRGYRLEGFEHVLGLDLVERPAAAPPPSRLDVAPIDATGASDWMRVLVEGFRHPDGSPGTADAPSEDSLHQIFRGFYSSPGFVRYAARWDGVLAGGASLRIEDGIAQLCGAATLPAYRRRGVQTSLLDRRLADAAEAGCTTGTVTTAPGSKSQQNAQRQGFQVLYVRALLVKRPSKPRIQVDETHPA